MKNTNSGGQKVTLEKNVKKVPKKQHKNTISIKNNRTDRFWKRPNRDFLKLFTRASLARV